MEVYTRIFGLVMTPPDFMFTQFNGDKSLFEDDEFTYS